MDARLEFFANSMLDFVALKERLGVSERLHAAILNAKDVELSIAKFYVGCLADLLKIAKDKKVLATTKVVISAWNEVVDGGGSLEMFTKKRLQEIASAAYQASHTGGILLGPDQKALDLIVARAAARSTGIPSADPQDAQHFGDGDGPEHALGNVGLLTALAVSKAPKHKMHKKIQPEFHTKKGKFDVSTFTKTRAILYSDTIMFYIDKLIKLL